MKLNKHGWGLKEMILLSSILLSFLFVAIFMIVRLYSGLNEKSMIHTPVVRKYTYEEIEDNVLQAALDYFNEYYEGYESTTITTDKMKRHGYITSNDLKPDGEKKACEGYVTFGNGDPEVFIRCADYETEGYEE